MKNGCVRFVIEHGSPSPPSSSSNIAMKPPLSDANRFAKYASSSAAEITSTSDTVLGGSRNVYPSAIKSPYEVGFSPNKKQKLGRTRLYTWNGTKLDGASIRNNSTSTTLGFNTTSPVSAS